MTTPQKGRIFISYRRTDSAGYAGRIYDRLIARFDEDAVFMDVDVIPAGVDFVEVLQNAVQSCDVLVALIGRKWLDVKDEAGKRRLDNPEDFVRVEIAAALSRDIRVIPVLVDGAPMPRSTELPGNLKLLARRNALQVNHHSFNADAHRLILQLELAMKAAEDLKKHIVAMSAELEKEERERKERAEQARKEKEAREKADVEERARLAAAQQAKKEREERERRLTEEKARLQETAERIRSIFSSRKKLPFFVGSGIVILVLLGFIIKNDVIPSALPTENTLTLALPSVTSTKLPTKNPPTLSITPEPKPTVTDIPTPMPTLVTTISEKEGMKMVYVPAGEFQMGSENNWSNEKPVHTVYLDAFWIDQTEVTNAMYAKCVDAGACNPPRSTKSFTRDKYYGNAEFDDYPVIYVSWYGASAYCKWADSRLPSEAEWEKAARGGLEGKSYPWGDEAPVCEKGAKNGAKFDDNANCKGTDTEKVGSYVTSHVI